MAENITCWLIKSLVVCPYKVALCWHFNATFFSFNLECLHTKLHRKDFKDIYFCFWHCLKPIYTLEPSCYILLCLYSCLIAHGFSRNPNSHFTSRRCVALVTKVTKVTDNPEYQPHFSLTSECIWMSVLALRYTPSHDVIFL